MEIDRKKDSGVVFLDQKSTSQKEWANALLCAFPIFATGLYRGGESSLALHLLGIYTIFLLSYAMILRKENIMERNIFLIPFLLFTITSFIATIFSPAFFSSLEGFIEYFAYLLFFLSLLFIKPEKNKLLLALFIFSLLELFICYTQLTMGRVMGTYRYASYIVIPLFFGLLYSFKISNKTIRYSLIFLFFIATLLTGSRVVFVLIVFLPFLLFKKKILWAIIPIIIGAVLLIPNPVGSRIKGKADIYSFQRPNLWKQAMKTAMDKPITGWGPRNYKKTSLKYNFPVKGKYKREAKIAHNQFLQYFADGGVIFLFAYILIFYVFILHFKKMERMERTFIAIILLHSLLDNPLYIPTNFLLLLTILYIGGKEDGDHHFTLSLWARRFIPILSIIYILPLVSSFMVWKGKKAYENKAFESSYSYFAVAESLWPIPENTLALATVQEQLFLETQKVGYLYFAFYFYQSAMDSDPLDWKIPLETYKFLMRNKKNAGVKDPARFLEKAIELNPKEKKLYETLIREYQSSGREEELRRVKLEMKLRRLGP